MSQTHQDEYDFEELSDESQYELSQSQSQPQSQSSDTSADQDSDTFNTNTNVDDDDLEEGVNTRRIIVDKTHLLQLFRVCSEASCGALIDPSEVKTVEAGAALTVTATCLNNHVQKWSSSGTVREGRKEQFTINILLAAYTLFCGLNISQVTEYFGHLRISCIGRTYFFNLQKNMLHKIVWFAFCLSQEDSMEELRQWKETGGRVALWGDGKFDSPGWSAQFCTYILQELRGKKIIGLWVAHKSMATSSSKMEPLAAKSLLVNVATEHKLSIDSITTDRSVDMKTMMNEIQDDLPENYPPIDHEYDVWHWIVAVQKDLWTASKLVSCAGLDDWMSSITNMMWYSFSSSIENVTLLKEKLDSITNHICNIHTFQENLEHRSCSHGPLSPDEERSKAWLDPDSLAVTKVKAALHGHQNARWNDLEMMTHFTHTGDIENFNSLMNKYAPKLYTYSHSSMFCRGALATLDHNSNIDRAQKKTTAGLPIFNLEKKRHGKKYIVKAVKEGKDYSFRDILASWTIECCRSGTRPQVDIPIGIEMPRKTALVDKPDKSEAILKHQSRFKT